MADDDFADVSGASSSSSSRKLGGGHVTLAALAATLAAASAYLYYTLYQVNGPQESLMLAVIALVTGGLMYDGTAQLSVRGLRAVAARAAKTSTPAPAAADEAVGGATLFANGAYVALFAILATQLLPNAELLVPSLANARIVSAAVAMLLPAGLVCMYGRRLI